MNWKRRGIPAGQALGLRHLEWLEAHEIPPGDQNSSHHRYVALQPIFTRQRLVFGYEAFSRSSWENTFTGDEDSATHQMIENWTLHNLHGAMARTRTFVNCTREALMDGFLQLLPTSTILELNASIKPDLAVLASCRGLKSFGYQIALDNFEFADGVEPLLRLADYVKVDFAQTNRRQRRAILQAVGPRSTTLVAQKIERLEDFDQAFREGFRLFQGYYLGAPTILCKRAIADHRVIQFRLAGARN